MKTEEDEAFDELAKRQGDWGGGYQAKRRMAADKLKVEEDDDIQDYKRPWVGLTEEEIKTTLSQLYCDINQMKVAPDDRPQKETVGFLFAKAIEAKLKEKNG
jgi:hypothetical protein